MARRKRTHRPTSMLTRRPLWNRLSHDSASDARHVVLRQRFRVAGIGTVGVNPHTPSRTESRRSGEYARRGPISDVTCANDRERGRMRREVRLSRPVVRAAADRWPRMFERTMVSALRYKACRPRGLGRTARAIDTCRGASTCKSNPWWPGGSYALPPRPSGAGHVDLRSEDMAEVRVVEGLEHLGLTDEFAVE